MFFNLQKAFDTAWRYGIKTYIFGDLEDICPFLKNNYLGIGTTVQQQGIHYLRICSHTKSPVIELEETTHELLAIDFFIYKKKIWFTGTT